MHGHILMKLIVITHHQVYLVLMTFSTPWLQRLRSHTTFSENAFSGEDTTLNSLVVTQILKTKNGDMFLHQ